MFSGPDWIFRRSSAGSSRPEKSYLTSSGPKQTSHTKRASRAYSSPHSLHLRASTAMPAPYSLWSPPLASVTEAFGAASPHLPDLNYWWPDGIGTVLIDQRPNRWLPGFLRAISLHPSGCVRLCGQAGYRPPRLIQVSTVRSGIL